MEVGGDRRFEPQARNRHIGRPSGLRQDKPFLSSRVADEVLKCRWTSGLRDAAEEEAIAAIQDVEVAQGQEAQGRADGRAFSPQDVGEMAGYHRAAVGVEAHVEEAGEHLGQLLAVVRIGDEAAPARGHALAGAEGLGGEAA